MVNAVRGESEVCLGEISLKMDPTCEALCSIEDTVGHGVVEIMDRYVNGHSRFKDTVAIIFHCQTNPKKYTFEQIGEMVRKAGLVQPSIQAFTVLSLAFEQPKKKEELNEETTTKAKESTG